MKHSYLLLFVLLNFAAFGQTVAIRGLLKDKGNNEPVVGASIAVKGGTIGTIANEEGMFQLTVDKDAVIAISCIGYKSASVAAADFTDKSFVVLLEQDEQKLDEVIVSKTPLNEMLEHLVATSSARFNKPILLHTYYREFAKLNGKYTKFSDGLLDYHISGTTKDLKSDLIVKQSRAARIYKDEDDELDFDPLANVQRGISGNYEFASIQRVLLHKKNYKDYDMMLKSRKDKNGKELYAITFEPRADVQKSLYQGSILYDPETNLILDVDIYLAPSHMQYKKTINILIVKICLLDARIRSTYRIVNNNYTLSYTTYSTSIKIWNKKRFNETLDSKIDLLVTDFSKDDLSYDKKSVYKEKGLYARGNKYTSKFWQENNAIVLTAEEENIIKSLEKQSADEANKPAGTN